MAPAGQKSYIIVLDFISFIYLFIFYLFWGEQTVKCPTWIHLERTSKRGLTYDSKTEPSKAGRRPDWFLTVFSSYYYSLVVCLVQSDRAPRLTKLSRQIIELVIGESQCWAGDTKELMHSGWHQPIGLQMDCFGLWCWWQEALFPLKLQLIIDNYCVMNIIIKCLSGGVNTWFWVKFQLFIYFVYHNFFSVSVLLLVKM